MGIQKPAAGVVTQAQIGQILQAASRMTTKIDLHMTLLTRALIAAAKAFGIPRNVVARELDRAWEDQEVAHMTLLPPDGRRH